MDHDFLAKLFVEAT